ncbi:hypothetical protein CAOG_004643 [Capsaspora owczarzaki ATCC 30864]|uniref:Glycoside hydrolase family 38 N-terminal domain-containing protein n=2 Tax=Capsaspora owczarzaki (strain ATCC 30864) TaxID=595528 RepID=A0A0D2VS94_CAPO3|nr:hypothetical protein CAOG_004643 [Capsaspora owczarzaki ATCC 30864]
MIAPVGFAALPLLLLLLAATSTTAATSAAGVDPASIKTVHVVYSNHLDVGFADNEVGELGFAANVVNTYFTDWFPKAINTSDAMRALHGGKDRYIWLTQAWLVSLYLDCPTGMKLSCPSAQDKAKFELAVRRGDITWHAYPFNAEAEFMDELLFEFGVELAHSLDDRFGLPRKTVMSQRDVPGTTRSIIPILVRNNVTALSIGANGASAPLGVPPAFVWEDVVSGDSIIGLYHPGGYGGIELEDCVLVEGLDVALAMDWRGDNAGPAEVDEVLADLAHLQGIFPNANVIASTFDAYIKELSAVRDSLPVVQGESGDSWVHGCGSDPKKVAQFRALTRERSACITDIHCDSDLPSFFNFSRLLLKGAEHTWGGDVKTFYQAETNMASVYYNWSNAAFQAVRSAEPILALELSWKEQRDWAIDYAVEALGSHPLASRVRLALAELEVHGPPSLAGYKKLTPGAGSIACGGFDVTISPQTGEIVGLTERRTLANWASSQHPLGSFLYQTFTEDDFNDFFSEYLFIDPSQNSWAAYDFGKLNVSQANPQRSDTLASLVALYQRDDSNSSTAGASHLLLELSLPSTLVTLYGAPLHVYVQYDFSPASAPAGSVVATVTWLNKTATRMPEAIWFSFNPSAPPAQPNAAWYFNKVGEWLSMDTMIVNGSAHISNVWDGVMLASSSHSLHIRSLDTGLVSYGSAWPFPTPLTRPTSTSSVSFNLFNNIWGTNYVMYYDEDAQFRFSLSFL